MSNRLCRAAGFSVLYVLMLWCTYEMFFFVSLFQCLTVLALAVVFLCSVVPGAVSEQGDRGCGSVFSSEGRFAV